MSMAVLGLGPCHHANRVRGTAREEHEMVMPDMEELEAKMDPDDPKALEKVLEQAAKPVGPKKKVIRVF